MFVRMRVTFFLPQHPTPMEQFTAVTAFVFTAYTVSEARYNILKYFVAPTGRKNITQRRGGVKPHIVSHHVSTLSIEAFKTRNDTLCWVTNPLILL